MTWDEIVVPTDLPETVDKITFERVVMNAGATWDYVPWHYDRAYAESHGHPTIFVNTMHLAGFVDRIATDWAGPHSRVVRRKVTLLGSIYAGDSMVGRGRAINKRDESSRHLVEPASHRRSPRRHHPAPTKVAITANIAKKHFSGQTECGLWG